MKNNEQIIAELHREYEENIQREETLEGMWQANYERWMESDCEDDEAYEAYEDAYSKYVEAEKKTNIYARLLIKYAFEKREED